MKGQANNLKVVDLFSGGGGLSLGFIHAGFDVVAAFDNWPEAMDVYRQNFRHPGILLDLSDRHGAVGAIREFLPDIIVGGPPCQDFSSAGKRDESGGRANLTLAFARIIENIAPDYFVMENVDRAQNSKTFAEAKRIFTSVGYGLTIKILDASLCGVPQRRKRLFVIGVKGGENDALLSLLVENLAARPMTVRDYFGDRIGLKYYYRHPRSYRRRAIFSIDEPSPTIRGVNRPVPKGYPGHPGDPVAISSQIRSLDTRERAMIQTFPDDYVLKGAKTDIEQIVGNAVPVKLAEHVAKSLKKYIELSRVSSDIPFVLASDKKNKYEKSKRATTR